MTGLRLLVLGGILVAAIGAAGHGLGSVWLTTTVGPTAYVLLAHPDSAEARLRSTLIGQGAAIALGLAFLAAFGLWNHPSVAETHRDTFGQIGAQALAAGCTLLLLTLLDAHHPPAAATTLLITSGIARPGPALYGLLEGLAATILVAFAFSALTRTVANRLPRR